MNPVTVGAVADQLADELAAAAHDWAAVLGPDGAAALAASAVDAAPRLAAVLCDDGDDAAAADAARDVLGLLHPSGPPAEWWRSTAGRAIAQAFGSTDGEAVTTHTAAEILRIAPSTVKQMLHRADRGMGGSGGLERHPDGGITRASVLARLVRP